MANKRIIRNPNNDEIIFSNDVSVSGNFYSDTFSVLTSVKTDLVPETHVSKSLGTNLKKWLNGYISNIYTNFVEITGQGYSKQQATLTPTGTTLNIDWNLGNSVIVDLSSIGLSSTELVTNGDFSALGTWVFGSGWSYSSNRANVTGAGNLSQPITLVAGRTYQIQFEVTVSDSNTTVTPKLNGVTPVVGTAQSLESTGIYTQYLTATADSTTGILFTSSSSGSYAGAIDNVSLKEVLPISFSNSKIGASYLIQTIQGLTPCLISLPSNTQWKGKAFGFLTTTPGSIDLIGIYYNGTDYLTVLNNDYGFPVG